MKISLFMNVLLVSSLAFVAVGCGKDKKKKGDDNNGWYSSNYMGTGSISGNQAFSNLQSYMGSAESKVINLPAIQLVKRVDTCKTKQLFGINALQYQVCSFASPTGSSTETSYVNVANGQVRSSYANLSSVMTAPAGYALINVIQQGQYIYVFHANVSTNKTIIYTIDTNLHAAINPFRIENNETNEIKTVLSPLY